MKNQGTCKIIDHYIIIHNVGVRCATCYRWIGKVRSKFYKESFIKANSKIYNRKKENFKTYTGAIKWNG